jgi:hypothetical protein
MEIQLTWSELTMGALAGIMRQIRAIRHGWKDQHGYGGEDGWSIHIEGACAELAVAKAMNLHWGGHVHTFRREGDLGDIEIRSTDKPHGCLIVRQDDDPNRLFVLVRGRAPTYDVAGAIHGKDAMKERHLRAPAGRPPAYFIPAEDLEAVW